MARVSAKRQITLPSELCAIAAIQIGDEVETYVDRQGVISIVKKIPGAAKGLLKDIPVNTCLTDEESLQSALNT